MELTTSQKKIITRSLIIAVLAVAALFLAQGFRMYIGSRAPAPELSESVLGGAIPSFNEPENIGQHTLVFRGKTNDGKLITDQVTFIVEDDPYFDPYAGPDPDPYAAPSPDP